MDTTPKSRIFLALAAVTWLVPRPAAPAEPPSFEAVLKPQLGDDGQVTAIAVDSIIHGGLQADAERLSLTAPVVYAGAWGIADRVRGLLVSDQSGPVPLAAEDDPANPAGFPWFRHWRAQREVAFPVRLAYRTEVEQPTDRRGPPFNIRPSAGGVSGAGAGFLVIPENSDSSLSKVSWDLGGFQPGAGGISSFGEGAFELAGPPTALWQGWYIAGPIGRYPASGDAKGFSAAWLGDFPFDPETEMHFVGDAYAWLGDYFGHLSPPPRYRVFMRVIESKLTHFSGTALDHSFMLSGGPDSGIETNGAAPRDTFLHEMIHMWVGQVEGPQGVSSWFSEGLTSYYTLVLPQRAGFGTVADFARGIDRVTERYYTSPGYAMSAQAIADVGFGREEVRRTPYDRGLLYFTDLDARIRDGSHGERSLDSVTHQVFVRRQNDPGYVFDHAAWVAAVTAEVGPAAAGEFQARIIEGRPFTPVPDAFGPCFERRDKAYPVEGGNVAGYQWVRKPDMPDQACR